MIKYRIKNLAQRLPGGGMIQPGEYDSLPDNVIAYQQRLKNIIELEVEPEEPSSSFTLKLNIEPDKKTYTKRKPKTRRNINDNSN